MSSPLKCPLASGHLRLPEPADKNRLTFCQKKYIVFLTRKGAVNDPKH